MAGTLLKEHGDVALGRCQLLCSLIFVTMLVLAVGVEGQAGSSHSIASWATNKLDSAPPPWALPGEQHSLDHPQEIRCPVDFGRCVPKKPN